MNRHIVATIKVSCWLLDMEVVTGACLNYTSCIPFSKVFRCAVQLNMTTAANLAEFVTCDGRVSHLLSWCLL